MSRNEGLAVPISRERGECMSGIFPVWGDWDGREACVDKDFPAFGLDDGTEFAGCEA
jgi:hypothetical protein